MGGNPQILLGVGMALTETQKSFILDYSTRLLTQDILTNSMFAGSGVGQDLRSMALGKSTSAKTFSDPFEEAISGTLRGDAASVRQAGRNVGEASSMMGVARTDMATVVTALQDMEDIIDKIDTGELDQTSTVVQSDYDALRDKITGVISNSDFNGIALLDGTKWGTSQIDSTGNVYIQSAKEGGFNITFHNVEDNNWASLQGSKLDNSSGGDRAAQLASVQSLKSDMQAILAMYESKEDSLQSQELQLQSQAQILDKAAQVRMPETGAGNLEKMIADLVAKNIGDIINKVG